MQHRDDEAPIGSAAEEAAKLLGALGDWIEGKQPEEAASAVTANLAGLADRASQALSGLRHGTAEHMATGAPECTYCPVCRTVHVVREASPDVRLHLASAALSLMNAATTVLNAMAVPPSGAAAEAEPTVETIDLNDDDSDW